MVNRRKGRKKKKKKGKNSLFRNFYCTNGISFTLGVGGILRNYLREQVVPGIGKNTDLIDFFPNFLWHALVSLSILSLPVMVAP